MRKLYIFQPRKKFWRNYWQRVKKDTNKIANVNQYPLHIIGKFINKKKKIIELGCGLGRIVKHYHYKGYDIKGIEYVKNCIDILKKEDRALKIRQADIADLPYEDETFDIAMAFGILGHQENNISKTFLEVNRVLKREGLLAGSLCLDNFARLIFRLKYFLEGIGKKKQKHFYTYLFTKKEIIKILEEYGFKFLKMQPILSKELLYEHLKFLRKGGKKPSKTLTRSDENYFKLNLLGESIYWLVTKVFPYQYTFAVSFLAKKVKDKAKT